MSTEQNVGGYGYASDEVKQSPFSFGLTSGKTFLTRFEWVPNGGKDSAEQEALDIVFNIDGVEKGYRQFPVVKAFGKDNVEITDPNSPEMKEAFTDFNAKITHILHCFNDMETIKAAFSRPIKSFKDFCHIAMSLIPKDAKDIPLDIFLQYQWSLRGEQKRTFLEIPSKMKHGRWLCRTNPDRKWKTVRIENPTPENRKALYYIDEETEEIHDFVRNGWYMNSNFANQQVAEGAEEETASATPVTQENAEGGASTEAPSASW